MFNILDSILGCIVAIIVGYIILYFYKKSEKNVAIWNAKVQLEKEKHKTYSRNIKLEKWEKKLKKLKNLKHRDTRLCRNCKNVVTDKKCVYCPYCGTLLR